MSTCNRCGISAWHPEAFACTAADCEIRMPTPLPAAASVSGSRLLTGGACPLGAAGHFLDQRAGDGETNILRGEVQGSCVHEDGFAA